MTTHEQTTQEMRDAFDALCKSRVKAAVDAEREACAKVCDGWDFLPGGHEFTSQQLVKNLTETIAHHIRARGETK